ncbi:MAG: patatin-like phospholipase family protein [Candidatus Absconditabacteria bacterium]|nr:patatin-like phospholipase family protein [Candidatus Absconditabacteria bacterium]
MRFLKKLFQIKSKVLVISGGGVRGFYALGILKALEDLNMKKDIDAIYGVSAGAIVGAYRSAGYSADWIFDRFSKISLFRLKTFNIFSKKSFLKNDFIHNIFKEDLPEKFKKLNIPLAIGTTDCAKGKYILYKKGNLISPLLGSMSIPGVFPPILFQGHTLMDGGLINNFPVDLAKKDHPSSHIIGIFLNKFIENQSTSSIINSLSLSYEILMRARDKEKFHIVDDLFYRDLDLSMLNTNKKQMKRIFDLGYQDGIKKFE